MTSALLLHGGYCNLSREEDSVHIGRHHSSIHLLTDRRNRARTPDACIVDQSIDSTEAIEGGLNDSPGNDGVADVAGDRDVVRVTGYLDLTRVANNTPSALSIRFYERR